MKKLFPLIIVFIYLIPVHANVILKENFNREVGQLSQGWMQSDMGTDIANWWFTTTSTSYIQVVDTNLTHSGYQTEASGKAIRFAGNSNKDVRAFNTITSQAGNSIYYSLLLNVHTPKNKDDKDYIVALLQNSSITPKDNFAQLRIVSNAGRTGYRLGISKANESWIRFNSEDLQCNTTYLVVVRYDFVDGDKNDVVSLWINPTKVGEATPTIVCAQDSINSKTSANMAAGGKDDAENMNMIYLRPGTNTPTSATIDELRITTKWAELFESGSDSQVPAIGINTTANFGIVYAGEKAEMTLNLTAENLTEDLTLSHTNTELSLSANTIAKAVAMAGTTLKLTLNPKTAGLQTDKITITSGSYSIEVNVSWITAPVTECATVAALKKAAFEAEKAGVDTLLRYTGTATVTRDTLGEFYIQDNSGAIKITDNKTWQDVKVGDNITVFRAINGSSVNNIMPLIAQSAPKILSSGNQVTPQTVSLSALQASPLDYLLELVTIESVAIDNAAGTFSAGNYTITQGDKSATLKIEMGIGITGTAIPEQANITGFSFNSSGSVIVPRGPKDIVNKSNKLLQNGGFEQFTTNVVNGLTTAEYSFWAFSGGGWALTTEAQDVVEGNNALKTTSEFKINGNLYQSIDVTDYNTGDEFELRIRYKVLTPQGDNTLTLASYWASVKDGELNDDADKLKVAIPNSDQWQTLTIRTKKPEKATKFELYIAVAAKAIVLFDDFAFNYIEPTAYFSVTPEKVSNVQANINEEVTVATFTVRQKGLKQPVQLGLGGEHKNMFKLEKTSVTAAEETVKVTYAPTVVGHHTAMLSVYNDESPEISLNNRTIALSGTAVDPTKKPSISINPTSLPAFSCTAKKEVNATIKVNSMNCTDYVYATIANTKGHAFSIDASMLSRNIETQTIVTFSPLEEGEYAATITWKTEGGEPVTLDVSGTATPAGPEDIDYATDFVWNTGTPLDIMEEGFNNAPDFRNKTLKVNDWQNVVTKGDRAWWGYTTDTTSVAKATGYYYNVSTETDMETWLVTPALNFKTPFPKQFGFRVMGEIIFDGQQGGIELYYIDATRQPVHMEHIAAVDALIPANDAELKGQWTPVVADLTGQPIADVFYIAFRFHDKAGANGCTYHLDDVTWGKTVMAVEQTESSAHHVRLILQNGQILIERENAVYTLDGRRIE